MSTKAFRRATMNKVVIEPRPIDGDAYRREAMARNLERLAWLMDRAFSIPGTRIAVGLDALIGLLPIGGDVLTGLVQTGLVLVALRHYKVPRTVAVRMMANVLIDIIVGAIPLLGDLFDVGFKANTAQCPAPGVLPAAGSRGRARAWHAGPTRDRPQTVPHPLALYPAHRRCPPGRARTGAHRVHHRRPLVVPVLDPKQA